LQRPLRRRKLADPKTAFRVPWTRQGETELHDDALAAGCLANMATEIDLTFGYANR
jgi:hypothetical protein